MRPRLPTKPNAAVEFQGKAAFPVGFCKLQEITAFRGARTIDKNVQPAEVCDGRRDTLSCRGGLGQVEGQRRRFLASTCLAHKFSSFGQRINVATDRRYARSGLGELNCYRPANSPAPAGDQ